MGDDAEEVALAGGSVANQVLRVGQTVRRPVERWSAAVHALLRHLEQRGFGGAPRFLGIDDRGREILSFIEGRTCTRPWVPALRTDEGLAALVGSVRRFHDAVSDFVPSEFQWVDGRRRLEPGQVVCHRDLGPWNTVWRDSRPVGFIDWDFAGPSDSLDDLAYVAFFCVPLRDDDHCRECGFEAVPDRRARLGLVCDVYGRGTTPSDLWLRAERHQLADIAEIEEFGPQGLHPWAGFLARNFHLTAETMLSWLQENRSIAT